MKITKFTYAIGLTVGFTLLSACGDEVTNVTTKTVIETVATFEKLSKCENDNVGALAFVADSAKTYTCTENGWVSTDGIDGKDGEDGKDGTDGNDGKNGKKGTKGADGKDGKNGFACITKELSSGKGYKIVCDGDSVGVILNGEDGPRGKQGENGDRGDPGKAGDNCELQENPDGSIDVTCGTTSTTIYMAICGNTPYNPETKTCGPGGILLPITSTDTTLTNDTTNTNDTSHTVTTDTTSCSGATIWCKAEDIRVQTGLDAGMEESGYWFDYNDNADGGLSKIEWPVPKGNDYDENALDPVIEHCQGLCGTVTLNQGMLNKTPFAGVGFNLAGTSDGAALAEVSVITWGGICITYTSDLPGKLVIGVNDVLYADLNYDLPYVNLSKSTTPVEKCFAWTDFKQKGNAGGESITGTEAASQATSLRIEFSTKDGDTGDFNIIRLRKNEVGQ